MLLLEQDSTRKEQVNKLSESEPKLNERHDKKYKIEAIKNSAVYDNKVAGDQLPKLYYLIFWKDHLKAKDT